jgi:hypothetical protein
LQNLIAVATSGRLDLENAFDLLGLIRIGGIGGEPVAQHEIGRLRVG